MVIKPLDVVNQAAAEVFFDLSPRNISGLTYAMQIRVSPGDDDGPPAATLTCSIVGATIVKAVGDCSGMLRGVQYVYELQEGGMALFVGPCRVVQKIVH